MKTFFILGLFLFLFLVVEVNAQKLEYRQTNVQVVVTNAASDSLFKPYIEKGISSSFSEKNYRRMEEWKQQVRSHVLPESVYEKIKSEQGLLGATLYFDGTGKIIDVTFRISFAVYDKLTEEEIRSMYNKLMKIRMNVEGLLLSDNFNFSNYTIFLKKRELVK